MPNHTNTWSVETPGNDPIIEHNELVSRVLENFTTIPDWPQMFWCWLLASGDLIFVAWLTKHNTQKAWNGSFRLREFSQSCKSRLSASRWMKVFVCRRIHRFRLNYRHQITIFHATDEPVHGSGALFRNMLFQYPFFTGAHFPIRFFLLDFQASDVHNALPQFVSTFPANQVEGELPFVKWSIKLLVLRKQSECQVWSKNNTLYLRRRTEQSFPKLLKRNQFFNILTGLWAQVTQTFERVLNLGYHSFSLGMRTPEPTKTEGQGGKGNSPTLEVETEAGHPKSRYDCLDLKLKSSSQSQEKDDSSQVITLGPVVSWASSKQLHGK